VKSTGDGVVGLLPSATSALRSAKRIRGVLGDHDLDVRIGVHVGDVDARGADVSGLAVNIAARVMALAGAGEIFVSESTVLAATGEGLTFTLRDRVPLKGLPGDWAVYAVD
jgi:class 3 adenylate cyclase